MVFVWSENVNIVKVKLQDVHEANESIGMETDYY